MVSALAFYSDDLSSNPAELYNFYSVNCLKRKKINRRGQYGPFKKQPTKKMPNNNMKKLGKV